MKKYLSFFIVAIILLSLCACSSNNNTDSNNNSSTQNSNTNQTYSNDSTSTVDIINDDEISNSESTVLIRYFRQRKELPYNDEMKNILKSIEQCEDKPKTEFVNKIGSISIKNNDEGSEDFANIYIGEDENIYAHYINNSDEKIAYKLDVNKFGLE